MYKEYKMRSGVGRKSKSPVKVVEGAGKETQTFRKEDEVRSQSNAQLR